MRYYEAPQIVFGMFSSENIMTGSKTDPIEPKTNLNEWLTNKNVADSNHIVVNMSQ